MVTEDDSSETKTLRHALELMLKYYDTTDHLIGNGCEHGFKPASSCPNADCEEKTLYQALIAASDLPS